MSVRIFSLNAIHSVIKTMFHKGPVAVNGACQKWHILSWVYIFQRNLAHLFIDGYEQVLEIAQ
jgi:hypothetical protein